MEAACHCGDVYWHGQPCPVHGSQNQKPYKEAAWRCEYVFEHTGNRCQLPLDHFGSHRWNKEPEQPTEMLSLRKINEKLDLLLAAKEDTMRFRELLLGKLAEIERFAKWAEGDTYANGGGFVKLEERLDAEVLVVNERLGAIETRLAAIFTRLCAQQEARRGKAVRGDRTRKAR
jgi:hypothetical protein